MNTEAVDNIETKAEIVEDNRSNLEKATEIMAELKIKTITSKPSLERATTGSAGYELIATHDIEIESGFMGRVETGVSLSIPEGYYFQLYGKSGHASRNQIVVLGGVIDSDYTGTIKVMLLNMGKDFKLEKGKSVAQGVLFKHEVFDNEIVQKKTVFDHSGFGSTGF